MAKVTDVVGLYLAPPDNAVVLCVDENPQIQALDRTAPILPLPPGLAEHRSHDYVRHGTTTLFAALEIATGQVIAACKPRHRHQEFLAWWLAILSQGESWHNLHHHADPTCARHGVLKGQVDVNAWLDVRRQMAEPGTPREKARVRMT